MVIIGPEEIGQVPGEEATPGEIEQAPGEEATPDETGRLTSDVLGEDILDVPRYPGSVRVSYLSMPVGDERMLEIAYTTSASIDEVLEFYEEVLPANGWTDITEMQMNGNLFVQGSKEGADVQIDFGYNEYYQAYLITIIHATR